LEEVAKNYFDLHPLKERVLQRFFYTSATTPRYQIQALRKSIGLPTYINKHPHETPLVESKKPWYCDVCDGYFLVGSQDKFACQECNFSICSACLEKSNAPITEEIKQPKMAIGVLAEKKYYLPKAGYEEVNVGNILKFIEDYSDGKLS